MATAGRGMAADDRHDCALSVAELPEQRSTTTGARKYPQCRTRPLPTIRSSRPLRIVAINSNASAQPPPGSSIGFRRLESSLMQLEKLLGIDLPIVQAPMAGVQGSAMAVAVSEAGGLGS